MDSELDDEKVEEHEAAAHQKRNWVRLTFDCNDHCVFCLDTLAHDGEMRDPNDVKAQILDGRRKGAERLILSGGEPTIHPRYVDFIKLGRLAGYDRIQTVTNGRMFRYREFLTRCLDAGLQEITFSLHGPNARIHDALVGVKGAFDQEVTGLKHALDDGRAIVNIDVCVNRGNVKQLPAMIETFYAMGVREFDLLHVIPFGNAWKEGREVLFYDLEEMRPYLLEAFAWARKPDVHVWLNRFPVKHCEGFHDLIQDPYKLNDEIRGRKEEYARWIEWGEPLDCREPRRCGHCYLEHVCDALEETQARMLEGRFEVLRVDARWEAKQAKKPVYGGDPASTRKGKKPLPLLAQLSYPAPSAVEAETLHVVARDWAQAAPIVERLGDGKELELHLDAWEGVPLERVSRAYVERWEDAERLRGSVEVVLTLRRENEAWLLGLEDASGLALRMPTWERLTESRDHDVALPSFFGAFQHEVPVEGVPACVLGRAPRPERKTYDAAVATSDGKLEIFRFIQRYIRDGYFTQSLRCGECVHAESCRGLHVNHVRAHGFEAMQPIR